MAHSPSIHAKNRNLASTKNVMLSESTQETNAMVVDYIRTQRTQERCAMTKMTKTLTALAAAATLGLAAIATPQPAEARNGGAIAAGIIGGLAVGALIGAAANGPYYGYGPGYYYGRPPFITVVATGPVSGFGTDGVGVFGPCGSVARA